MATKQDKPKRKFRCKDCGGTDNVTLAPDPYNEDMHGDATKVRMCEGCRQARALEL